MPGIPSPGPGPLAPKSFPGNFVNPRRSGLKHFLIVLFEPKRSSSGWTSSRALETL
jgi:hypothetical protein